MRKKKKRKVVPYPHVRCRTSSDAVCVPCHGRHPEALPGLGSSQSDGQLHGGDQKLTAPRGVHPADLRPAQDRADPLCEYAPLPPHHPVRKVTQCAPTLQRRRGCARLFYDLCSVNHLKAFWHLQKHYFSCKNQFDMNTLKSAYTQASSTLPSPHTHSATHSPLQFSSCDRPFSDVANLLANRWRRRACIKPWGNWICCSATLRRIWLQRGTKTPPEEQLTDFERGKKKPASLRLYWNELATAAMSFHVLRLLLSLIVLRTSFQTILCLLTYIPDCHLKEFIYFSFIYVIYDEPLLLNKAVDTDNFGFLLFLFEHMLQSLSYIYHILQSCLVGKHSNVNSTSWCCNLKVTHI